jgi:hypothetical protein
LIRPAFASYLILSSSLCVSGQTLVKAPEHASSSETSARGKAWTPTRTPDGQPDIQGIWTNSTATPFERPDEFAGKQVLTEEEATKLERRTVQERAEPPKKGEVGNYNDEWFEPGTTKALSSRQASLVVDPPDGRVPVTPAGEAKRDQNLAHESDSYVYMTPWDRCITRGVPGSMFPAAYNNGYQIVQTPGYVVIVYEMIHNARIILLDKPHSPSAIRQWDGDSRGHWEGDTLVVDTTNFTGKGSIASNSGAGRLKGVPETDKLHVVERFKRVSADTISYSASIDDPGVYSRPWKVAFPLTRDPAYQIYEYACHEGNSAVESILRAGRNEDSPARGAAATKTK